MVPDKEDKRLTELNRRRTSSVSSVSFIYDGKSQDPMTVKICDSPH